MGKKNIRELTNCFAIEWWRHILHRSEISTEVNIQKKFSFHASLNDALPFVRRARGIIKKAHRK
jgi:hypothetical protein